MVKPTFICIGVQKAGTSSLINYLSQHTEIYMKHGESHFFDKPKQYKLTTAKAVFFYDKYLPAILQKTFSQASSSFFWMV